MFKRLVGMQWGGRVEVQQCGTTGVIHRSTDCKVRKIGHALSSQAEWNSANNESYHINSPLKLLWWASLFVGAGGQQVFPTQLDLAGLDGVIGFTLNGDQSGDSSGRSVSSAGDVNGDGITDLLIGAWRADADSSKERVGKVYVVFGKKGIGSNGTIELADLDGADGFVINGKEAGDEIGAAVSSAGDVNGDGIADFLIGMDRSGTASKPGEAYVIFGRRGLGRQGSLELASLDGTNGFVLKGQMNGDGERMSVSGVGDLNADGTADLVIGTPYANVTASRGGAGKIYVVFGNKDLGVQGSLSLSSLNGVTGFVLNGEKANDNSGRSLSSVGDINADGIADLIVGALHASIDSDRISAGKTYVVFGGKNLSAQGSIELSSLDGMQGFVFYGERAGDESGRSVSYAGDVSADGVADLLIGADEANPSNRNNAGRTYAVFGGAGLGDGGTFELSSVNGMNGFILNGESANDNCGYALSGVGDINADGIADLIIGAPYANDEIGKAYIVFGKKDWGSHGTLELSSLDGTNGFVMVGEKKGDNLGRSVAIVGDVNGDGISDFVVGADDADPAGNRKQAGKTYVIFGRKGAIASEQPLPPPQPYSGFSPPPQPDSSFSPPRTAVLSSPASADSNTSTTSISMGIPNQSALPSSEVSFAGPLAIASGVCAVFSSIIAAIFALRARRQQIASMHPISGAQMAAVEPEENYSFRDLPQRSLPSQQSKGETVYSWISPPPATPTVYSPIPSKSSMGDCSGPELSGLDPNPRSQYSLFVDQNR